MNEEQRLPYVRLAPEGIAALQSLEHYLNAFSGLEAPLLAMIRLRVSQLNGCEFCIGMHSREMQHLNEPKSLIDSVDQWRSVDVFTHRQRAALQWAEEVTDMGQARASEAAFAELGRHFSDKEIVDLTLAISSINAWNRLSVAFRTPWRPRDATAPGGEPASSARSGTERPDQRSSDRQEPA